MQTTNIELGLWADKRDTVYSIYAGDGSIPFIANMDCFKANTNTLSYAKYLIKTLYKHYGWYQVWEDNHKLVLEICGEVSVGLH